MYAISLKNNKTTHGDRRPSSRPTSSRLGLPNRLEDLHRVRHGLVLAGLGGPGPLVYKRTRRADRGGDRAGNHQIELGTAKGRHPMKAGKGAGDGAAHLPRAAQNENVHAYCLTIQSW